MFPKTHVLTGAIISILIYILTPITPLQTLTIFIASFLIDIDHYLLYLIKTKDPSLKRARKHFFKKREKWLQLLMRERKKYKRDIFFLHSIESWIILFLLATLFPIIYFIILGFLIHMTLDYIEAIHLREKIYPKFSIIYTLIKNQKKTPFNLSLF